MTARTGSDTLQHIDKADQVAGNIILRIADRVAHARLSSQVNHSLKVAVTEKAIHTLPICQVEWDKPESGTYAELPQPRLLKPGVVIVVQAIYPDDLKPICEKPVDEVRPDKTSSARDQNSFVSCFLHHFPLDTQSDLKRRSSAGRGQMPARLAGSVRSLSGKHDFRGSCQNVKIKPRRPVSNVITVQAHTIE